MILGSLASTTVRSPETGRDTGVLFPRVRNQIPASRRKNQNIRMEMFCKEIGEKHYIHYCLSKKYIII